MEPLAEGTHLIHIGPQKTGSTAIQSALHRTREDLRARRVVYPGPHAKPREAAEVGLGFARIAVVDRSTAAWDDLLRQVGDPDARRVCVSLEAFGRATDEQIERIVEHLGGPSPHVLAVARRYDALLPSQWQQRVKSPAAAVVRRVAAHRARRRPARGRARRPALGQLLGAARHGRPGPAVDPRSSVPGPVHPRRGRRDRPGGSSGPSSSCSGCPTGFLADRGGRANTSLTLPAGRARSRQLNWFRLSERRGSGFAEPWFDLVKSGVVPALLAEPVSPRAAPTAPPMPGWAWPEARRRARATAGRPACWTFGGIRDRRRPGTRCASYRRQTPGPTGDSPPSTRVPVSR